MSIYVGIQGYTDSLTNIVTNGLLTSNITGWTTNTYFNYSYNDCTQLTVKTAQSGTTLRPIYQNISISGSTASTNQVLYAQATVKGSSSNSSSSWPIVYLRRYLNGGTSASQVYLEPYNNTLNDNQWHKISLRISTYVSSSEYYNYDRICFSIKPPLVLNNTCYYKNIILVNLTEKFGRGNEPTKEWCDSHIYMDSNGDVGYIIPGSVAIKMNRLFVGVNNVARKVKKAYIGINGVARKFFGPILKYIGTTSTLSSYKCDLASAVTGNYALFAGGISEYYNDSVSSVAVNTVDAYDNTLIKSTPSNLATAVEGLAGVSFNNYALFGGGKSNAALYPIQTTVNVYNNSLSKLTSIELSTRRHYLKGGKIGNYALFAGGYQVNITNSYLNSIDAFNTSLVLIDPAPDSLSQKKCSFATAQSSNYLLFAGGQTSSNNLLSSVDAYNTSLVKTTCTDLSVGRPLLAGTAIDNIYLFAGGGSPSVGATSVIDVYNSLVKTDSLSLSVARYDLTGVVIDEYIIFAGGATFTSSGSKRYTYASDVVDVFNKQLISISGYSLSSIKAGLASAVTGNYALFAGGTRTTNDSYDSGGYYSSNTVDVFQAYY